VSEVLNISFSDILPSGHFYLHGSKGSRDRVYFCSTTSSYFSKCGRNGINPFDGYDRFFIYRTYKKFGIGSLNAPGAKSSVTHAFRHIIAEEIYENTKDMETVGDFLRHKSRNSTKYYVNDKKNKK
jgi:site-specific recombinase XerD